MKPCVFFMVNIKYKSAPIRRIDSTMFYTV